MDPLIFHNLYRYNYYLNQMKPIHDTFMKDYNNQISVINIYQIFNDIIMYLINFISYTILFLFYL